LGACRIDRALASHWRQDVIAAQLHRANTTPAADGAAIASIATNSSGRAIASA
jgi:hypothetical protein